MALKVIGAGYGRTGTLTLKTALEMLGLGPCHHMIEVIGNPAQVDFWNRAADGDAVNWDDGYDGYQSTVDWPGCAFYAELASHYPDAKVILSTRDPERWFESADATILTNLKQMTASDELPDGHPMRLGRALVAKKALNFDFSKANAMAALERHNAEVRAAIPAARLLEFEVSEGWEPLCNFLDVPVPADPFPRTNAREDFGKFIESVVAAAKDLRKG